MPSIDATALVFAHEGGWDEMLLVGGPILVIGLLLMVANRRAKQLGVDPADGASEARPAGPDPDVS